MRLAQCVQQQWRKPSGEAKNGIKRSKTGRRLTLTGRGGGRSVTRKFSCDTASEARISASMDSSSRSMRSIFSRICWSADSEQSAARSEPTWPWVSAATYGRSRDNAADGQRCNRSGNGFIATVLPSDVALKSSCANLIGVRWVNMSEYGYLYVALCVDVTPHGHILTL